MEEKANYKSKKQVTPETKALKASTPGPDCTIPAIKKDIKAPRPVLASHPPVARLAFAPLVERLAEISYISAMRSVEGSADVITPFSSLEPQIANSYCQETVRVLESIDKCNLMLTKKMSLKDQEARARRNIDTLTIIIEGFVKGLKTTKPALFPCGELAHKIYGE
uniref:Uncharacterized protein n=1 Tax=viral metagenome TaxID=1070528 RepID=A0A6M3IW96_9ZZZZ